MVFPYLMSNKGYIEKLEIFKTDEILRSTWTFSSEVSPEVEYTISIAKSISYILSF